MSQYTHNATTLRFPSPALAMKADLVEDYQLDTLLYCPNAWAWRHRFINQETGETIRARCNRWDCLYCGPRKVDQWRQLVKAAEPSIRCMKQWATCKKVVCGDLEIDTEKRHISVAGRAVVLTPIEYAVLGEFANNVSRVLTTNLLQQRVWGPQYSDATGYVKGVIRRLRVKLEQDPAHPRYIITEPYLGYRLQDALGYAEAQLFARIAGLLAHPSLFTIWAYPPGQFLSLMLARWALLSV